MCDGGIASIIYPFEVRGRGGTGCHACGVGKGWEAWMGLCEEGCSRGICRVMEMEGWMGRGDRFVSDVQLSCVGVGFWKYPPVCSWVPLVGVTRRL